jgi:hypothetical protein
VYAELIEKFPESEICPASNRRPGSSSHRTKKFIRELTMLNKHQVEAGQVARSFCFGSRSVVSQHHYADSRVAFGKAATYETFPRRLEAAVSEATAQSKLGEWAKRRPC